MVAQTKSNNMKNLYLILFVSWIFTSCENSNSNLIDPQLEKRKQEFVSECISTASTFGFYDRNTDEHCECSWNETLKALDNDEINALRRDFIKKTDFLKAAQFIVKSTTAGLICGKQQLD